MVEQPNCRVSKLRRVLLKKYVGTSCWPYAHLPAEFLIVYLAITAALHIPGGNMLQVTLLISVYAYDCNLPCRLSEGYTISAQTSVSLACSAGATGGDGWGSTSGLLASPFSGIQPLHLAVRGQAEILQRDLSCARHNLVHSFAGITKGRLTRSSVDHHFALASDLTMELYLPIR